MFDYNLIRLVTWYTRDDFFVAFSEKYGSNTVIANTKPLLEPDNAHRLFSTHSESSIEFCEYLRHSSNEVIAQ